MTGWPSTALIATPTTPALVRMAQELAVALIIMAMHGHTARTLGLRGRSLPQDTADSKGEFPPLPWLQQHGVNARRLGACSLMVELRPIHSSHTGLVRRL